MEYRGIDALSNTPIVVRTKGDIVDSIEAIDEEGRNLPLICHGFLDMQVNGYEGSDYSLDGLNREHIERIIASMAASGTTQHVATIVTSSQERLVRNLRTIARERRASRKIDSAIVGCHIEGPYISSEDGPRGAHDPRYVRDPSFDEFLEWQDAAEGLVKIVTVAPERKGALEFIEKVSAAGVIVAIGHTAASPERIREAVAAGCKLSTHLGNGSHATLPRLQNYIWEQLASDELAAGIISDGFHLPASVVKAIARAKGLERLILVSDAAPPGGYAPGKYKWGNLDVEVYDDGHLGLPDTKFLAGAAHLLDWDLPAFMRFTGAGLEAAIRLCTINPSRLLAPIASSGLLSAGSPANIVLFRRDKDSPRLSILQTVLRGEEIWRAEGGSA